MNKSMKPTAPAVQKPLTEEEKKLQTIRFFQQKRESFAQGILYNMVQNPSTNLKSAVATAVKLADELIESLYPVTIDKGEKKEGQE